MVCVCARARVCLHSCVFLRCSCVLRNARPGHTTCCCTREARHSVETGISTPALFLWHTHRHTYRHTLQILKHSLFRRALEGSSLMTVNSPDNSALSIFSQYCRLVKWTNTRRMRLLAGLMMPDWLAVWLTGWLAGCCRCEPRWRCYLPFCVAAVSPPATPVQFGRDR